MSKQYILRQGASAHLSDLTIGANKVPVKPPETQELTASGAITIDNGTVMLNHATVAIAATLDAPTVGDDLVITDNAASGTAAHTVTLPEGVTFDGTNNTATFNAPGETLHIRAISPSRWLILENIGSVGLSDV